MTRLTRPLRERVVHDFCAGHSMDAIAIDSLLLYGHKVLLAQVEQILREALKGTR